MSRPLSPHAERVRAIEIARDAFLRASAACLDWTQPDALALALLEGAIGLQQIAKADDEGRALERVTKYLTERQSP